MTSRSTLEIYSDPTIVMNKDTLVGAQSYEVLDKLMEAKGVKKRTNS